MARLNDIFRRLLQSGTASSKQRQGSVRLGGRYSDQEDHHAQGGDIRRWQRKRFPETSEADDEMPNIGDSSMTHTEPVESQSPRSSTMVLAVYREPLEQDGSWANSLDLSSWSLADGRNLVAARPQSERRHRVTPSSSNGVRLETRAYDDMVRPDDGRQLWSSSPGNRNFSFAEARDIDYQPSETEPEVMEVTTGTDIKARTSITDTACYLRARSLEPRPRRTGGSLLYSAWRFERDFQG